MVKGEQDPTYLKLQQRFDKTLGLDIEKLLQIGETEGLEQMSKNYIRTIFRKRISWDEKLKERLRKDSKKLIM